jgi:hypothetical protein
MYPILAVLFWILFAVCPEARHPAEGRSAPVDQEQLLHHVEAVSRVTTSSIFHGQHRTLNHQRLANFGERRQGPIYAVLKPVQLVWQTMSPNDMGTRGNGGGASGQQFVATDHQSAFRASSWTVELTPSCLT